MMIADSDGKTIAGTAFQFLEIERAMTVITLPKLIALVSARLNVTRKRCVELPETARAF